MLVQFTMSSLRILSFTSLQQAFWLSQIIIILWLILFALVGGFLPPPQEELEQQYKEQLDENFGITFNKLYAFTNFPIKRFADFLMRRYDIIWYYNY